VTIIFKREREEDVILGGGRPERIFPNCVLHDLGGRRLTRFPSAMEAASSDPAAAAAAAAAAGFAAGGGGDVGGGDAVVGRHAHHHHHAAVRQLISSGEMKTNTHILH
jgi:hypothetical protein